MNVLSLPISEIQWLHFVKKKKDANQRMQVICPDEMLYCLSLSNLRSLIRKKNVLIRKRMCGWMRAHEWEKETLNDQWTKWTNERTNDRSVCTFDWEKCWNNFDIAYSSLIWRKKSRIYECIEFGIGDVDVITSCTENENVLNRMLGWSTPIVEKRRYFTKPEVNVQWAAQPMKKWRSQVIKSSIVLKAVVNPV